MSKTNTDYASELHDAVKSFIDQPLNNPLNRSQIVDIARIALPVLEQQLQQVEGDWIEWSGGECPVIDGSRVDVKWRNGQVHKSQIAYGHASEDVIGIKSSMAGPSFWRADNINSDIIAYRLVKS